MNKRQACVIAASFSLAAGAGFAAMAPAGITASNAHARNPATAAMAGGHAAQPQIRKLVKASASAAPIAGSGHQPWTTTRPLQDPGQK